MSRCIACNVPVDALSELCGSCAEVSNYYVGEALRANEEPLERDTRGLPEFTAWLLEHPEIEDSWAHDGLGLLPARERSNLMYLKAKQAFLQALEDGLSFRKACEVATKGAARGNLRYATEGNGSSEEGTVHVETKLKGEMTSWDMLI